MTYDLLFRRANVVDGSGRPSFVADVAVRNGRIAEVGRIHGASAGRVVDAEQLVLSPGFIDLHTHSDFTLPMFPRALSMTSQGVTTQLVGNCGFSPFPVHPDRVELIREYTAFLDAGLPWGTWHTAGEFFAMLDRLPLAGNVACQVGHGSVRVAAMGFDTAPPSKEQLAQMYRYVADAMAAGAFGMSSGLTYAPASAASTEELVVLARAAAAARGFYSTHIRSEATTLAEAVQEALDIGAGAAVPVQLSHHKSMGRENWAKIATTLAMVDAATNAGADVLLDQYPYAAGSTGLVVVLPQWAMAGGIAAMRQRLREPEQRERIREQIAAQRPADLRAGLRVFEPDTVVVAEVPPGPLQRYLGRSLTEIAAQKGQHPVDTALDLLSEAGGDVLTIVYGQSEENVRAIMRHPRTAIASDGWTLSPAAGGRPHPRSYGTYARVLGRYVRQEGVLGLEEAIRKMTSLPARRLGLTDRGLIQVGQSADVVMFDPNNILDQATFAEPHKFCDGVRLVVVNGTVVVEDGQDTGATAGRVLRNNRRARQ